MGKGELGCGANMARCFLFTFNVILWICGLCILAIGIWLAADPGAWDYVEVINDAGMDDPLLATAVYVMIGVGAFIFLVGGAGCWGACQKSSCWLMIYAVLIGITLIVQIVAAILAGVFRGKINDTIHDEMTKQVQTKYGVNYSQSLDDAWDAMQKDLKCCGSTDYTDYKNSNYTEKTKNEVPESCCVFDGDDVKDYDQCKSDAAAMKETSEYLHTAGCYDELKSSIQDAAAIVIGILVGIAVLELLGLIMACCLRRSITEESHGYA